MISKTDKSLLEANSMKVLEDHFYFSKYENFPNDKGDLSELGKRTTLVTKKSTNRIKKLSHQPIRTNLTRLHEPIGWCWRAIDLKDV